VPGFDAVCRTVQAGLGISLIPEPVFRILGLPMGLHIEQLTDGWAARDLKIITRADRPLSAAAALLVDHLTR
jgi:DNA-binding transcriptional LysR family regulator